MKNQLLILIILGLASNLASRAQTAAGTAGGTSAGASGGRATTGGAVMRPQTPAVQVPNQTTATLLQQQQALRQQQIQQAQQQSLIGGLQQSGSAQNVQPQATLNQTTGAAAQPPQVGVATGLSASPTATTGQAQGVSPQTTTPGTLPTGQLVNGTTTTLNNGTLANQVVLPDGTIATIPTTANPGTINSGLSGFATNAAGALVPAVGTLATVPPANVGPSTVINTNTVVAVQPAAPVQRPVLIQRTAKPALVMDDLPEAVQKVLKGQLGDGSLYNLEKTANNHGTTYRASFKNDNKYRQVEIAEDGTVINDNLNTPSVIAAKVTPEPTQPVNASALPEAVLTALKAYGGTSDVQNIELVPSGDRSVYNIRVNHEGTVSELQIAKDGSVTKKTIIDPLAPAVTTPIPANEVATATVTGEGALEIPPAVRNTIRAQGGATQVQNIRLATVDGKPVYEVATQSDGKAKTLQISPDGRIVNGQGLAVAITDLPAKVQTTVKDEVGGAIITGIQKESRNGQSVYNIRYNAKNGADTHLILGEDGRAFPVRQSEALGRPAGPNASTLQLSDLPTAARKTIMNQAGTASLDSISVRDSQGQTIYSATFKKNGESQTVDVSQDGTLLKPE